MCFLCGMSEMHRIVLNQILRQSTTPLSEGPFSVLVDYTKVLDFDVKRRYFRQELERMDDGVRREDLAVHVRRDNIFEDSFRELHRRTPDEWKHRFYIVFEGLCSFNMLSSLRCFIENKFETLKYLCLNVASRTPSSINLLLSKRNYTLYNLAQQKITVAYL